MQTQPQQRALLALQMVHCFEYLTINTPISQTLRVWLQVHSSTILSFSKHILRTSLSCIVILIITSGLAVLSKISSHWYFEEQQTDVSSCCCELHLPDYWDGITRRQTGSTMSLYVAVHSLAGWCSLTLACSVILQRERPHIPCLPPLWKNRGILVKPQTFPHLRQYS